MPPPRIQTSLTAQLRQLSLSGARPQLRSQPCIPQYLLPSLQPTVRAFSTTPSPQSWISGPPGGETSKSRKGRCHVPTGGSMRGTTVMWGDYGLRMRDHDRRIKASQLKIAEDTVKKRLRGMKFRFYTRIAANIGVYTSGNDQRMGKGKGSFDYWCARVSVSKVIFEIQGDLHEQVVRDAFRLAANKLPGLYEFVKRGDPPKMGITKVGGEVTAAFLKRPRLQLPLEQTAARLPSTTPVTIGTPVNAASMASTATTPPT